MVEVYLRKVQYHETDKMGITHHANYIKWMEEARIDYLEQIGYSYAQMEADGIISPVIGVECHYKRATTFNDVVQVQVWVEEFTGVRLIIGYKMTDAADDELVLSGRSTHCFTDAQGRPIILKRSFPKAAELLAKLVEEQ